MPTLEESALRAGHWRWVEQRLFETVGGWAPVVPEPEVKLALATQSLKHAWHAELWRDRLPRRGPVDEAPAHPADPADLAVGGLTAVVAALGEAAEPGQTLEKLVGLYRVVLPRLAVAYRRWLERLDPASDGPTIRWLSFVVADELDDWREGEAMVQSFLRSPADVARAAAHQARLESLVPDAALHEMHPKAST